MKKQPIFRKILVPLMGLVLLEILILISCVFGQGLIQELKQNEIEVVNEKVSGRKSYIENYMIHNCMNLGYLVERINSVTEAILDTGEISPDALDDSSENAAILLNEIAEDMIEMMRSNRVTGAFLVLNTEDLEPSMQTGQYISKPGIYLRDSDPNSQASQYNSDIQIERSPISFVQKMGITTGTSWNVNFDFQGKQRPYYDFLYKPFQTAYHSSGEYTWSDMGYWSSLYQLEGDKKQAFSYSVPLILEDGTVYGVLGVDITLEYLQTMLPFEELDGNGTGTYFLARYSKETGEYCQAFGNGAMEEVRQGDMGNLKIDEDQCYLCVKPLVIYNSNAPFSEDQWVLAGVLPYKTLNSFVERMKTTLAAAILVTLLIGIGGSLVISFQLQRPIASLSQEIETKNPGDYIKLQPTGILEIDQMSEAVEHLSRNVLESGKKFSTIIEMASVRLAGFQVDYESGSLFLTQHFFRIFGREDIEEKDMGIAEFRTLMQELQPYFVERASGGDGEIYQIPDGEKNRFVRVKVLQNEKCCYGLAEDVTQSLLEKKILTHERDHDSLTNLYNRRAFRRKLQGLFEKQSAQIGIGAFLMIDLDNLKYINDTYGHDYGDRYIMQAAASLEKGITGKAIYARISGDEFNVFTYGYRSREEGEEQIRRLKQIMDTMTVTMPDGTLRQVQASGGVAWYPEDSRFMDELAKYADYAMYVVKKNNKGEIRNFDKASYENQDAQMRNSAALIRLIETQAVHYVFQPIVNAHTGDIFAYEALMRPDMEEFSSVKDVLETARREGKLNQIEEMTWSLALKSFVELIHAGKIAPDSYLFINSIPNQRMNARKEQEYAKYYGQYHSHIVLELTEEEQIEGENWGEKQKLQRELGGRIALDDYGTGYNSEKTLLSVSPDYIKVDIAIVKEIQINSDKRAIMEYIVNFAHERGKYIIAEGVETREEAETVIALGADYLQGYYLARPSAEPSGISEESRKTIEKMRRG